MAALPQTISLVLPSKARAIQRFPVVGRDESACRTDCVQVQRVMVTLAEVAAQMRVGNLAIVLSTA